MGLSRGRSLGTAPTWTWEVEANIAFPQLHPDTPTPKIGKLIEGGSSLEIVLTDQQDQGELGFDRFRVKWDSRYARVHPFLSIRP